VTSVSAALRAQIDEADRRRCCYCWTSEANSGIPMTIDHIHPISKGGETSFENVCFACRTCNEFKADHIQAVDPLSGNTVVLFNPRAQIWSEHFRWSADGAHIEGVTTVGRATALALRMNNPTIIAARSRWVGSGWHPPSE
jgi:hypothetical protein